MRWEVIDVNIRIITKEDQMSDFPETHNENMVEIERAINNIVFEIARIKDDIEHLKNHDQGRLTGGDEQW